MADVAYTREDVPFIPVRSWLEKLEIEADNRSADCSYDRQRGGWYPTGAKAAQEHWAELLLATLETVADWGWHEDHPQFAPFATIMVHQLSKLSSGLPLWAIEARVIVSRHVAEYRELIERVNADNEPAPIAA